MSKFRRRMSPEDRQAIVEAYLGGSSIKGISRDTGWDQASVRDLLKRIGVSLRKRPQELQYPRLRDPDVACLLGTMPDLRFSETFGCHHKTVWRHRRRLGIPAYKPARLRFFSIDAPRMYGGTYHEVYKDASWDVWLEEMGATVW